MATHEDIQHNTKFTSKESEAFETKGVKALAARVPRPWRNG